MTHLLAVAIYLYFPPKSQEDVFVFYYCRARNLATPNENISQRPNLISDAFFTTPQNLRITNLLFFWLIWMHRTEPQTHYTNTTKANLFACIFFCIHDLHLRFYRHISFDFHGYNSSQSGHLLLYFSPFFSNNFCYHDHQPTYNYYVLCKND